MNDIYFKYYYPSISLKSYLKNKNIKINITYKTINYISKEIDRKIHIIDAGNIEEFSDMETIVKLIYNFYSNNDLLENINTNSLFQEIDNYYNKNYSKIDVICVSTSNESILYDLYLIFLLKRLNKNIKVIAGGVQVETSVNTQNFFNEIDVIDYIICGTIETGIEDYINNNIKTKIHFPNSVNLSFLNDVIYSKYDISQAETLREKKVIHMKTSFGCPNSCGYCMYSNECFKFIKIDLDSIIDTIKYYNKIGNVVIEFIDNTFNFSKKRIHDFCDKLISINNQIEIHMSITLKNLDKEIFKKLNLAKIKKVSIGFENHNLEIIKKMNYQYKSYLNYDDNKDVIVSLLKNNISVNLNHVYNLPMETFRIFYEDFYLLNVLTKDNIIKQNIINKNLILCLYPYKHFAGSSMYENPEKFGISYVFWERQEILENSKLNDVITKIPKFYLSQLKIKTFKKRQQKIYHWNKSLLEG